LRGGPENIFGWAERLAWLVRTLIGALLARIAASLAIGVIVARLVRWCARLRLPRRATSRPATIFPVHANAPHAWFLATAGLCTLAFTASITNGTFRLLYPETFGHFYDYQALSFLQGRLDLPESAHSSESFVFEGKHYIYFGPTPAVLRLPFVFFNVGFGVLSRSFMVASYVAFLAAVYALLIHVSRRATRTRSWPAASAVMLFVATAGAGSTIFFLSSRAYIYHEAILCGATLALWSGYFSLRYLAEPERSWWAGAAACGIAAVHARPTTGLFALSLLGCAAIAVGVRALAAEDNRAPESFRSRLKPLGRPLLVAIVAVLGVLSFNALSYVKFKSFEGAPLKYHVQYQNGRLAGIEGRNFHLSNLRFNFDTYVWKPNFVLRPRFPFFLITNSNPDNYPAAKIDLAEPAVAVPYTMPALCLLALAGGILALIVWPEAREPLLVVAAGATPMSLALFTAVAASERYTTDFCPALLMLAAFAMPASELLPSAWRRAVYSVLALLCITSVLITIATTLHYQGEVVWGVSDEVRARYQILRDVVDTFFGLNRS
jgi:hypothetical protein